MIEEDSVRPRWVSVAASLPTIVFLLITGLALVTTWGCRPAFEESSPLSDSPVVTESQETLTLALMPERNVFEQKSKYLHLQEYLASRLEMNVQFKLLDTYDHIFSELMDDTVDGGFWGSMNGTIVQTTNNVEMLSRPVWNDGTSTYRGYLFTKKKSGVTSDTKSWAGRSIAFVNKVTTAGFLFPLSLLRQSGVTGKPEDYFRQIVFAGSHDASIMAVLHGEVDMGACKDTIFREVASRHPVINEMITIIAESPPVPSNALGVRQNLPQKIKTQLKQTLVDMHNDPSGREALTRFGAVKFIATSYDDYLPVVDMAENAGIDLSNWPLRGAPEALP